MRYCEQCERDVRPNGLGECPDCHAALGTTGNMVLTIGHDFRVMEIPRDDVPASRKIHLAHPDMDKTGTGCGRGFTGNGEVVWTEDGVGYATCRSCIRIYDAYA